jgi:hypothetical protein
LSNFRKIDPVENNYYPAAASGGKRMLFNHDCLPVLRVADNAGREAVDERGNLRQIIYFGEKNR